jgi:uncharacterized protein (TIGR03435 family)
MGAYAPVLLIYVTTGAARSQSAPIGFEVVSIKPMPPGDGRGFYGCHGGPGSSDPGQITCCHASAPGLIRAAFDMSFTRVSLPKPWGWGWPQFVIAAKVPRGATKEQVQRMWQNLLKDRFKLAVHREIREMPVYDLVVARSGFKSREWDDRQADPEAAPWEPDTPPKRDKDGFPKLPPGQSVTFFTGAKAWYAAPAGTIQPLAAMLERRLLLTSSTRPVIDATGLQGKYDLKFWWSPAADSPKPDSDEPAGPSMLKALESQLGLKAQPKKSAPVEILVVDLLEATPTEN